MKKLISLILPASLFWDLWKLQPLGLTGLKVTVILCFFVWVRWWQQRQREFFL